MLGFSMIQLTKEHSDRLDKELRTRLVHLYKPMRRTPCFLHSSLEKFLVKNKKFPVIIEFKGEEIYSGLNKVESLLDKERKCKVQHQFPAAGCCSGMLTASGIEKLLTNECHIRKIYYDREVTALLDVASPSVRARELNKLGLTGKGVNIAVVDTGLYPHEDFTQPNNRIIAFKDVVNDREEPYDDNGHGTHCAGDAAGNGFSSDFQYRGPAPEAGVIGVKVLNKAGSGSISTIMAGIQWCMDHKEEHHIDVISLSLGGAADESDCNDPLVQIVEQAWDSGIFVCVAAGNSGPDERTIATPGISPKVVTVGALDDRDTVDRSDEEIASFSSRGPACGGVVKPDLVTPGVNVISLRSPGSFLDKTTKANRVENNYFSLSGTSMATPICAGVAALILQAHPEYTPDQVKQKLISGAVDMGLPANIQGAGYLDAEKAVGATKISKN
ncbi:S8 family peptidase [Halobacillus mangrovi]|uniref:S8 family peptidase n=1 Tax=Halobacillus mangrovi TaxID=402384 RepID=UPI003D968265